MCVGKKWIDTWKLKIDNFSKDHNLHILTDDIDKFKNALVMNIKEMFLVITKKLILF